MEQQTPNTAGTSERRQKEEGVAVVRQKEEDIAMMLACKTHIGTKNLDYKMSPYVYTRNAEGNHIINLSRTWEKLNIAARILVAIENPADIVVVSARPYGSRPVLKFAQYTGAQAIAGRWMPGTLTNQITKKFIEPRVLVITDPRTDAQAVRECAYANIPVIGLCDTDACLQNVDVVVPCNNKTVHSIALMYWMLAREVLRLRGAIPRDSEWKVIADLFFWRDPEFKPEEEPEQVSAANEPVGGQLNVPQTEWTSPPHWDEGDDWSMGATAAAGETLKGW